MSMEEIEVTEYTEPPKTGFVGAIKKGFRGYVVWNARSTRSEYWWWTLFIVVVSFVAAIIDTVDRWFRPGRCNHFAGTFPTWAVALDSASSRHRSLWLVGLDHAHSDRRLYHLAGLCAVAVKDGSHSLE
jgi:hypothetical protein